MPVEAYRSDIETVYKLMYTHAHIISEVHIYAISFIGYNIYIIYIYIYIYIYIIPMYFCFSFEKHFASTHDSHVSS